ncbi:SDR family NAD(P)-dependent oxidoreductase [Nocardioides abyssi]|uniref:SDR family NAD(P)-dependent oxidoreductase n=1 Tax=Nocardioides abyssi TaxID=3058370 RepID=A0ABT8EVH8_9ACTN|nr:SDR family NAD(P)-dependent oxidoreductase [Nocardioides abyssi]MDN4162177.1 SDR family NAD(P)-dependent oxidoreductase [Nocardioides abyssi]
MSSSTYDAAHPAGRPLALVTGASSGIGLEIAKQLAGRGHDLLVVATGPGLDDAAAELQSLGAAVEQVRTDLATRDGVEDVHRAIGDRAVAFAALNAGVGSGGPFRDTDLDDDLRLIDLDVRSTVHLAKHLVRGMTARGSGRLLFTSSISATHPDAYEAVYGASKTFVQSFAKALRRELVGTGVSVTALMPGPTATNFFHRAGMDDTRIGASDSKDDPAEVARLGVEAALAGQEQVVPGLPNKLITAAARVLPDRVKAALHGALAAPGSGR